MLFPSRRLSPLLLFRWPALMLVLLLGSAAAAQQADRAQVAADEALLRSVDISPEGDALVKFFRERCQRTVDERQLEALVRRLGDEEFATRQEATTKLLEVGLPARPFLRDALSHPDVEVLRRAEYCLEQIEKVSGPSYLAAAVRLLAHHAPEGAVEVLLDLLPLVESEEVRDEVAATLAAVGFPGGKAHPVLARALADELPARRGVAATAFALRGGPAALEQVKPLLADRDVTVRQRAALALLRAKERSSVPVLIELLADLPAEEVWPIEDALYRLAGEEAPSVPLGSTLASRQAAREAWKKWWSVEGQRVDLARAEAEQKLLGYTLVIVQDMRGRQGKVLELDGKGKVRWQLQASRYPVDAQVIAEDRILVADYSGRTVTEYNKGGKVLWQKQVPGSVLSARRERNGNTFVVTRNEILELDGSGKQVLSLKRPTTVTAAVKMRNGNIALVDSSGRFYRLDRSGKVLQQFPVGTLYSLGSNIEVLPSGGVLVPQYSTNAVVEYDARGKEVWRVAASRPTSVKRLPNGHTLIGSRLQRSVVEVDRSGKSVWQYTADGRVMGVSRR